MEDQPHPETNPLEEKIARALAGEQTTRRKRLSQLTGAPGDWAAPDLPLFRSQARAVIEALNLDFTERAVITPDRKHLETIYLVTGGWTEAGGNDR